MVLQNRINFLLQEGMEYMSALAVCGTTGVSEFADKSAASTAFLDHIKFQGRDQVGC